MRRTCDPYALDPAPSKPACSAGAGLQRAAGAAGSCAVGRARRHGHRAAAANAGRGVADQCTQRGAGAGRRTDRSQPRNRGDCRIRSPLGPGPRFARNSQHADAHADSLAGQHLDRRQRPGRHDPRCHRRLARRRQCPVAIVVPGRQRLDLCRRCAPRHFAGGASAPGERRRSAAFPRLRGADLQWRRHAGRADQPWQLGLGRPGHYPAGRTERPRAGDRNLHLRPRRENDLRAGTDARAASQRRPDGAARRSRGPGAPLGRRRPTT